MAKKAKFGEISDGDGEQGVRANLESSAEASQESPKEQDEARPEAETQSSPEVTEEKPRDQPGPKIKEKDNMAKEFPQYDRDSAKEKLAELHEFILSKKEDDVVRDHKIHRQHYYAFQELAKNKARGELVLSDGSCEMIHHIHKQLKNSGVL